MNPVPPSSQPAPSASSDPADELGRLIATLLATEGRLEELTAGEVDTVSDGEGHTFLLRRAQVGMRLQDGARHTAILDALPLHVALIDQEGVIVSVNSAWKIFADANSVQGGGLGPGANYLGVCDRAVGADAVGATQAAAGIRSILDGSATTFTLEYPFHAPTGPRWFQMGVSPVATGAGTNAVVMLLDITDRRLAAQDLHESESRFRQLAENIREVFFLREADGSRMLYVSPAYEEIWGRSRDSLYADPATWTAAIHDEDRGRAAGEVSASASGDLSVEYRVVRPDGSIRWVLSRGYPVLDAGGSLVRIAGVAKDVTDQKHAMELLAESRQRLALATGSARIGIWDLDLTTNKLYWDAMMYELYSIAEQDFRGDFGAWQERLHPADRERMQAEFADDLAVGNGVHSEFRVVWPSGEVRVIEAHSQVRRGPDGVPTRMVGVNWDITERKRFESELAGSERRYSELLGNVELAAMMLDRDARITFCNDYLLRLGGWTIGEVMGRSWFDVFLPDDPNAAPGRYAQMLASVPDAWHRESEIFTRSGEPRLMRWNNSLLRSGDGQVIGSASIGEDITERRGAELSIKHLNRVYAVLSGINGLIVRVRDRAELFNRACQIAVEQGGFSMAMIGMLKPESGEIDVAASAGQDPSFVAAIERLVASATSTPSSMVAWVVRERSLAVANDLECDPRVTVGEHYAKSGVRSKAVFPLLVGGACVGVLALYSSEINFFHEAELKLLTELADDIAFAVDYIDKSHRLDYLAFYDGLTGLPNSKLFKDHLDRFIHGARQDEAKVGVVVLDLERFTRVNDTLGRTAGDELLRAVAARLVAHLVEPYVLARIGADTFAVASPYAADVGPTVLHDCIFKALDAPFTVSNRKFNVSAQAGIALFPLDGEAADELFTNAESALKLAKTKGTRFVYFSKAVNTRMEERFELAQQLRDALAADQFVLHYQPRVDMISGEAVGAEALIRWIHPVRGLMAPADFIPLAEETGSIIPIGAHVLDAVCAQQSAWIAEGLTVVPVAVNLSSVQFEKGDLVEIVGSALERHRLPARMLELELTESAVMNDPIAAAVTLKALCKLGVGLALDDFGTGYSSLAHLKGFPFNMIKIDRSFIGGITTNVEDAAIAKAIIAMAHGLQLRVVAEGVETQGQFNFLRNLSCNEMQGHFYSAAVPASDFRGQLAARRRLLLAADPGAHQRTLLMVDDDTSILASLTRMLRRDGYRILHANGGEQGLELLALHDIQVIISDQRMPGMSGTEFLSKVSQLHPNTVRIILSGFTDLKVVTEAVNRGSVFKFLTKPWDDDQLREQVRDAFRRHRSDADAAVA